MSYIKVCEEEGVDPIEVPTEDDDNHSILLSTLSSQFPGAFGLKYKNTETGTTRAIRLIGGRLQPPEEGWDTTPVYYCSFAKDNKRKSKAICETTPNSKVKKTEPKSQQKDSGKKRKLSDEERAKREEERVKREEEKARQEALKKEERLRREEEKARKEAQKEEERVRKEEEKAKREEERARKEALKEEEKARKEEERARKEAQREEERVRREEEKARKEAQKEEEKQKLNQKTEKQKEILRNFFIKKSSEESVVRKSITKSECSANGLFLPFQLCENQTIAQIVPESAKRRFNSQELDRLLRTQDSKELYLDSLKRVDYKPLQSGVNRCQSEIIIESQTESEDNQMKRYRVKRLQFHENVRPPYRGTFRKKSSKLKAKKPFNKDSDLFDYEVDSDEEWDEGGPGESLDGSDSDGSVKDDYEIDNDFFVPHGYLSDDENDENEDKIQEIVENNVTNGDQKEKCLPLLKEQVLMAERNRSFSSNLKPILLGCVWESNDNTNNKSIELLLSYKRMTISSK